MTVIGGYLGTTAITHRTKSKIKDAISFCEYICLLTKSSSRVERTAHFWHDMGSNGEGDG